MVIQVCELLKKILIKEVQSLAEMLGRTPKKREFERHSAACYWFKSWNNFIQEAGLVPLKKFNLTVKDYEKYIHGFVEKHGRTPTKKDFDNDIYLPDSTTIEKALKKTWSEILVHLGYQANMRMNDFSDMTNEEILKIVKEELERIGSTTIIDYKNNRRNNTPSEKFLRYRLNMKWNEMLKLLDLKVNVEQRSKEEWLNLLRAAADNLGKTPSIYELYDYGLNESVYKLNFGSYNNAVKLAGLEPNAIMLTVTETDDELLEMYIDLCKRLAKVATAKDISHYLKYSSDVFAVRFGGINNLRRLAGYEIYSFNRKYTKSEIKNKLAEVYKRYNKRLTKRELQELSKANEEFPSISTIMRYFQTTKMNEVWEQVEKDIK